MGIPLPGSGSRSASGHSPLTAKQPEVLRCKNMSIAVAGQTINLLYPDLDPSEQNETLRAGHYRGRDSKWSRKKIEQKYKTSERKVSKKWSVRKDGSVGRGHIALRSQEADFSRVFPSRCPVMGDRFRWAPPSAVQKCLAL